MEKELKEKIISAYQKETPDIKQKVIFACQQESQVPSPIKGEKIFFKNSIFKMVAIFIACILTLCIGLGIGINLPQNSNVVLAEESKIYLDVNPSIKLSIDKNNKIILCEEINEDGKSVLEDMQLKGVDLKTALNAIVGAMYVKGYLSQTDNSMLISVETTKIEKKEFLTQLTKQVNGIFENTEMQCSIIAQAVNETEQIKERAKENGVSIGKAYFIDKITNSYTDLTEQEKNALFKMNIKDLSLMYSHGQNKEQPPQQEGDKPKEEENDNEDVVLGSPLTSIDKEQAKNLVLETAQKDASLIEFCDINVRPSINQHTKVIYAIKIKFKGDENVYKYEVDCLLATVTLVNVEPYHLWGDKNPMPPQHNDNQEHGSPEKGEKD